MSKYFIDISEHNTILSFNAIPKSNLCGVIMKATEGTTYIDHAVDLTYEALHGKIPLGFYHFLSSTSSPVTQARNFWDKIKDKEYQILPVLDVEEYRLANNAEWFATQFMEEFYKLSGQGMIIYSGRFYIQEHFSDSFKKSHIWWVADYSANEVPKIDYCDVIAWQYTENCQSYAFAMNNLDASILEDETKFFISKFTPSCVATSNKPTSKDIGTLQNELIIQGFTDKNGKELIIDGVAGELTLSACPILKYGAIGNITMWLQNQLEISADGIFGEITRQAVIVYQENMSMDGDGIVGQNTWRKLLGL